MTQFGRMLTLPGRVLGARPATGEQTPLSSAAVRRGLRLSIAEGMFAQVHISLTSGAILTGLALLMGAGNMTLAILSGLPLLLQPFQLLSAWLVERQGARKPVALIGSMGRLMWLLLVLLPYAPWTPTQRIGVLLLTIVASNALITMCGNAWTQWMTDLVPPRERGSYFGTRNMAISLVAMGANYGAGWWLDYMRAQNTLTLGYALMFALACGCAAVSTMVLFRQPEPPMRRAPRLPLRDLVRLPLRHAEFRRFLGANMAWQVALAAAAPFFSAHGLSVLQIPFKTLALFDSITAATSLLCLPLWGRLADRWGHRKVMLIGLALVIPLPLNWALATPGTLWILYMNAGAGWYWLARRHDVAEQPADGAGAVRSARRVLCGLCYADGYGLLYCFSTRGWYRRSADQRSLERRIAYAEQLCADVLAGSLAAWSSGMGLAQSLVSSYFCADAGTIAATGCCSSPPIMA